MTHIRSIIGSFFIFFFLCCCMFVEILLLTPKLYSLVNSVSRVICGPFVRLDVQGKRVLSRFLHV